MTGLLIGIVIMVFGLYTLLESHYATSYEENSLLFVVSVISIGFGAIFSVISYILLCTRFLYGGGMWCCL